MKNIFKTTPNNGKTISLFFLFFLLILGQHSYAQRITRQYNNVSFSAALKDLNAHQHKYGSSVKCIDRKKIFIL